MKRTVSGIIVLLLLLSALNIIVMSSVGETDVSESGLTGYSILGETADWWTMFRHDASHTGYTNSTLPIVPSLLWNTSSMMKDSVRSSVAISEGRIFVGSSDTNVYALDAATGQRIWSYSTFDAVVSSPATAYGTVFFGSLDNKVYALLDDPNHNGVIDLGEVKWTQPTGDDVVSSPAVADGVVFIGSLDGYVYAFNATNGNEMWRFWTASRVYSSPAVSSGRVYVGASDGRVYALSVTGRYEWHFDAGGNVSSSPSVVGGKVFVGSDNGEIYALNETDGKIIWSNSTGYAVKSSPAVANGRVFVGSMNSNGTVYALNATTGNILWNFTTGGFVYSSPAVANDSVVVGSGDNRTYVLSAATGFQLWNYTTGGPIYSSPTIAEGMLFIGSDDNKVYAFGRENVPPSPKISPHYPEDPFILQNVTFDGSASYDPDGIIVNCTWNFGDGTIERYAWGSGKIVAHAYGAVGTYNVTLTVTDDYPISGLRKTNTTSQLVTAYEAWPMYRHDWNHKGYSTSLAPVTNGIVWNLTIGPDASSDALMYPSPVVVDGVVYISSTNGTVYALNAKLNGATIWKWNSTPAGAIHSSPTVADGMVFVGSDDNNFYALNATNGNLIWKYTATGKVVSSAAVAYGKVFVASRDGYLHALPEKDPNGDGIINSTERKWRVQVQGTPRDIISSPAVADGKVFFGSLNWIYALNATSGAIIIPGWPKAVQGVTSSPTVADGKVFVGSDGGRVRAYLISGAEIWSFATGNSIKSSPAVAYGKVFVGSNDGKIYALSTSGTHLWNKTIGSVSWSSPAVAEHKIFIGSENGIYAFRENGTEVWSYEAGGPFDSSPAIFNDTLYATSKKGVLYAFWSQVHDVAVTELIPSQTEVVRNQTVTFAVRVENQGSFNETNVNVTAQYEGILFNSTSINLVRGEERLLTIRWNTTGVVIGSHIVSVNATLAPPIADNDTADNAKLVSVVVELGLHDIGVTNVTFTKNIVGQGLLANISVTVKNKGTLTENSIIVAVYWSNGAHINQTIDSTIIPELTKNSSKTVSITWNNNATGIPLTIGNYNISAYAWPVLDETDTTDNVREADETILVTIQGDVSGDKKVDGRDIALVAKYFGYTSGFPPNVDVSNDGKVDGRDNAIVSRNFGRKYP